MQEKECPFCHKMITEWVNDFVKLGNVKHEFIRCLECQNELDIYMENVANGIDNDD